MPRKQTRPVVEDIRRKCNTCGSVKTVVVKKYNMPPAKFTPTMNNKPLRKDIPGVGIEYYCSYECSEQTDE
jgi:hypothetical protein